MAPRPQRPPSATCLPSPPQSSPSPVPPEKHPSPAPPTAGKQALADKKTLPEHTYAGLEQSEEMVDFLHDNYFAAGVGDDPMLEAWPPKSFSPKDYCLHAFMLAMWGMPIGELWDMERLAEKCAQEGRYTFFLTSSPDFVHGGVGSRPNALAIF